MVRGLRSRLGEQEGDLERSASQRRQRGRHVVEDRSEQIGERGEGERGLGLDASVQEDDPRQTPRLADSLLPENRLADPRLARENERPRALLGPGQERARSHPAPGRAR